MTDPTTLDSLIKEQDSLRKQIQQLEVSVKQCLSISPSKDASNLSMVELERKLRAENSQLQLGLPCRLH